MKLRLLLTVDLEEFTLPLDFNKNINKEEALKISFEGYKNLEKLVNELKINMNFFVSPKFATAYPRVVKKLLQNGNEIAIHAVPKDLKFIKEEKEIIEGIIKNQIFGFRSHKLTTPSYRLLKRLHFKYSSSLHPTYVPNRYNNITAPTNIFIRNGIIEIPVSVMPVLRLPFSFVWFRNFGLSYAKLCTLLTLKKSKYINIYFHPWEFVDIKNFDLPFYVTYNTGEDLYIMLKDYLQWCLKNNIEICTVSKFLSDFSPSFDKIY